MSEQRVPHGQRSPVQLLLIVLLPAIVVLAVVAIVAAISGADMGDITRDPVTIMGADPLVGALSQAGVILWWIAAGVCLFAYVVAKGRGAPRSILVFLLTAGLLTVLLAVDDQFLIHDELASRYLGLRERHVMLAWLALAAGWFALNLRVIRRSEWILLVAAFALFAGSIALDLLLQMGLEDAAAIGTGFDVGLLLEDGLKFVGITAWGAYLIRFSYFALLDEARADTLDPSQSSQV